MSDPYFKKFFIGKFEGRRRRGRHNKRWTMLKKTLERWELDAGEGKPRTEINGRG